MAQTKEENKQAIEAEERKIKLLDAKNKKELSEITKEYDQMKQTNDDAVRRTQETHQKMMTDIENDHKRKRKSDTEKHDTLVTLIDEARKMSTEN